MLYGLCLKDALALVVTPEGERIASLGTVEEVEAAYRALACDTPSAEPSSALAVLRRLLVAPLRLSAVGAAGLTDDARPLPRQAEPMTPGASIPTTALPSSNSRRNIGFR